MSRSNTKNKGYGNSSTEPIVQAGAIDPLREYRKQSIWTIPEDITKNSSIDNVESHKLV